MMIVDDNPRERKGIQTLLNWHELGIEIVASFGNGQQALDHIESYHPDIILTDITMPVLNGIKMSMILKQTHPHIKIIFMSGYNEFDYARSAVDLDIYGYILKPIIAEELEKVICKVLHIYKEEQTLLQEKEEMKAQLAKSLPLFQEQFLRDLIFGTLQDSVHVADRFTYLQVFPFDAYEVQVLILSIHHYGKNEQTMDFDQEYFLSATLRKRISTLEEEQSKIYVLQNSLKEFVLVAFRQACGNLLYTNIIDGVLSLKEEVEDHFGLSTTIGISKISASFLDLPVLYHQSMDAIHTKFYSSGNQVIFYEEIEEIQENVFEGKVNLQNLYKEIKEIMSIGDRDTLHDFIHRYFDSDPYQSENYIRSLSFSIINIIQLILIEQNDSFENIFDGKVLVYEKLSKFETIHDIRQWVYNILKVSIEHLVEKHRPGHGQIVDKIKEIITQQYRERITVHDIADLINFSSSHANNIFKSATGQTIFDYLTEYRIGKAKELLKDPLSKIYLVAEEVGYTNKAHFSLQFKKITGLTPAEYKSKAVF